MIMRQYLTCFGLCFLALGTMAQTASVNTTAAANTPTAEAPRKASPAASAYLLRYNPDRDGAILPLTQHRTADYEFEQKQGRIVQPVAAPAALSDLRSFNLLGCNPILRLQKPKRQ